MQELDELKEEGVVKLEGELLQQDSEVGKVRHIRGALEDETGLSSTQRGIGKIV